MRAILAIGLVACGGEQHHDAAPAATVTLPPPPTATATAAAVASTSAAPPSTASPEAGATSFAESDAGNMFGASIGAPFDAGSRHPILRQGATTVTGSLPPEVIQRIVRQNFGRFKLCYENGLRSDPTLSGKVTVKFTIDGSGSVSKADKHTGTTLPDTAVVQCIVRAFSNLSFPQPEGGGSVTVVYPLVFRSGD